MNKKAFTLVELLAIILLLLAICMISYPTLTGFLKNNEVTELDTYKKNLCLAAKSYINAKKDDFISLNTVGAKIEIPINDLVQYGNVDYDLAEPNTDDYAINHSIIVEVKENKTLECIYR